MNPQKIILPLIILSQFLCTSLWFAGNSIVTDLITTYQLNSNALSYITSSVQLGFIMGTLSFALLSISDLYAPSKIFFISALVGAIFNLVILIPANNLYSLLIFRFLTGFCLAGIYPIGMKIAADYFDKSLGKSLGYLVGSLVLGTAFPHFLKLISNDYPWQYVIIATSTLAILGGLLILIFVPKGPYYKRNNTPNFSKAFLIFKNRKFRQAAIGYFGHMWELYTFWTFVPIILITYNQTHPENHLSIPLYSFIIIGSGSLACVLSGYLSEYIGLKKTATYFLIASCICCLVAPFTFYAKPLTFISFLIFWGWVVIADSPIFSTLVAKNTEPQTKGTALTIVNCIGFSITIVSIQILSYMHSNSTSNFIFLILAIGPIIGISGLLKKTVS